MVSMSNRVHIFARPESREDLVDYFTNILECTVLPAPLLVFAFPGGGSFSVEFTEDSLDVGQARRGAWFELRTDDPDGLKKKVEQAGLPRVEYAGNNFYYFQAPGGQVWRIV